MILQRKSDAEVMNLEYGMDFRLPEYRREVFLRFYEFHLKYKAHPGAVYYAFPHVFKEYDMDQEQRLWFTFINGVTQNVITTFIIWEKFRDLHTLDLPALSSWFRQNYERFGWDTDRRYVKNKFEKCVESYLKALGGRTQAEVFNTLCGSQDPFLNFRTTWDWVSNNLFSFGRLATFSYTEYLRISGLNLDCDSLFMDDISGSKSHRNGICKVIGRDDWDWHKQKVEYSPARLDYLSWEGSQLLEEAKQRFTHEDLSYFTLESTLCCYKSWHRPNRRYPNVYNDMYRDRILSAQNKWRKPLNVFWESREEYLPRHLRVELNKRDVGVDTRKQNHYLNTGQVIMMDRDWSCFSNEYNDYVR